MTELFIDGNKLPDPLSEEELCYFIKQARNGLKEARDTIITHNIRLVLHEVIHKFQNITYDKRDLVSIGIIGLIKAIDTYDTSKGVKFSPYAVKCIDNEILMFIRKLKKDINVDSLDIVVYSNEDGNEIKLSDYLSDGKDLVEENENAETYKIIRKIVNSLPDRDREIIMLHFGFYNDRIYTQREIADKLNTSQPYISRTINKIVNHISRILEFHDVIELHSNQYKLKRKKKINNNSI